MFRRPQGKNLDPLYKEENSAANYPYSPKKTESYENPPRIFDSPITNNFVKTFDNYEESPEKSPALSHPFHNMVKEEIPETTLGEGVTFRGELTFERLLRIDGTFEGELLSQGKVIVGPKGRVKANLNLREAIIEGVVEGNVTIQERLEVRGHASIQGDIRAKSLMVDEGVTLIGFVEVVPQPPTP